MKFWAVKIDFSFRQNAQAIQLWNKVVESVKHKRKTNG